MTTADATSVLGPSASEVFGKTTLPPSDCIYSTTPLPVSSASISLQEAGESSLARWFRDRRTGNVKVVPKTAPKPARPTVVAGLGDEALWDGNLTVRTGIRLLTVTVKDGKTPNLSKSIALARLGVARLGG